MDGGERNALREVAALLFFVLGPPLGLWWAWSDSPASGHPALIGGLIAGAVLLVAYAFVDRARRGSFFITDAAEVRGRRERMRSMLPLYLGAAVLAAALAPVLSSDLRGAVAGFMLGILAAAMPFVVANYWRLRRTEQRPPRV